MHSADDLKTVITNKLLELNEQLVKYNELRQAGLAVDHNFENLVSSKKKILEDLWKIINDGTTKK
jgi:hypothetical protein